MEKSFDPAGSALSTNVIAMYSLRYSTAIISTLSIWQFAVAHFGAKRLHFGTTLC